MAIISNEAYENIFKRKSVRSFSTEALSNKVKEKLTQNIEIINNKASNVRIVLTENKSGNIFKGLIGSYGVIKNAPLYAAFIGKKDDEKAQFDIGYYGEAFILSAISEGLGTCWIAGTYHPEAVSKEISIAENEQVFAVTPIGYPAENEGGAHKLLRFLVGSAKRKPLDQISDINEAEDRQDWTVSTLEALRAAPSAKNVQPWYVRFEAGKINLFDGKDEQPSNKGINIDFGIALLHLELGAYKNGKTGSWVYPLQSGSLKASFELDR